MEERSRLRTAKPPSPKPVSERIRPEITRLPPLTFWRRVARGLLKGLARLITWLFTDPQIRGLENVPAEGGALVVSNHLGDADLVLGIAYAPRTLDALAKAELYDLPIVGALMEAYGVIWVHRGQPDRRAIRAALKGLAEGRLISIAPEGRESVTGALEEGTHGASFLASRADTHIMPITFTGTENNRIYANMKRLRRTRVTITIGPPFKLEPGENKRDSLEKGTKKIMQSLARQLPPEYQGAYRAKTEQVKSD